MSLNRKTRCPRCHHVQQRLQVCLRCADTSTFNTGWYQFYYIAPVRWRAHDTVNYESEDLQLWEQQLEEYRSAKSSRIV
jgi:hypothetical protein